MREIEFCVKSMAEVKLDGKLSVLQLFSEFSQTCFVLRGRDADRELTPKF